MSGILIRVLGGDKRLRSDFTLGRCPGQLWQHRRMKVAVGYVNMSWVCSQDRIRWEIRRNIPQREKASESQNWRQQFLNTKYLIPWSYLSSSGRKPESSIGFNLPSPREKEPIYGISPWLLPGIFLPGHPRCWQPPVATGCIPYWVMQLGVEMLFWCLLSSPCLPAQRCINHPFWKAQQWLLILQHTRTHSLN